jgi:hypothetical protein
MDTLKRELRTPEPETNGIWGPPPDVGGYGKGKNGGFWRKSADFVIFPLQERLTCVEIALLG